MYRNATAVGNVNTYAMNGELMLYFLLFTRLELYRQTLIKKAAATDSYRSSFWT